MPEILAKKVPGHNTYQTLAGHTIDDIKVLAWYLSQNKSAMLRFCRDFYIDYEVICHTLFLTLFLHDIGKASSEYQENIITGEVKLEVSHPFFAMPFTQTNLPGENQLLLRSLILSHHNQLHDYIYRRIYIKPQVNYYLNEIKKFIASYREVYKKYLQALFELKYFPFFEPPDFIHSDNQRNHIFSMITVTRYEADNTPRKKRLKAIYCYLLSIIKFCDQQSSKTFSQNSLQQGKVYGDIFNLRIKPKQHDYLFKKALAKTTHFRDAGKEPNVNKFNLILAPINHFRREIVIKQALQITGREHRSRIIYVLPYQLASEPIFEWLKDVFGPGNVGLIHTMSYYNKEPFIPNELRQKGDSGRDTARELRYGDRIFDKPVTITTIDHLIYTMVHGYKQSDYALGKLLNSVVIFEGFNPNSNPSLRYLADCIKLLLAMKVPCLGATSFVPGQYKKYFYQSPFCEITDLHNRQEKVRFKIIPGQLEDNLDEIVQLYHKEKKQLVFCDNIYQAQRLYLQLKKTCSNGNVLLLHSAFNSSDRFYAPHSKGKQFQKLNGDPGPWIIVTTQALLANTFEVNCNVVHSGTVSVECLLHRMNTLYHPHRGDKQLLYVYPGPQKINPETTWEELDNRELSFPDMATLYYRGCFPTELQAPTNLIRVFDYCTLFGYSPQEVRQAPGNRKHIQMWHEAQYKMDVIPQCLWKPSLHKYPQLAQNFFIKLPYYWYSKYPEYFYQDDGFFKSFTICKLPYNSELGPDLSKICPQDNKMFWI